VMNNRTDFERAQAEHWYRIPVPSAPDGVRDIRRIAVFAKLLKAHPHHDVYLTAARPEGVAEPASWLTKFKWHGRNQGVGAVGGGKRPSSSSSRTPMASR